MSLIDRISTGLEKLGRRTTQAIEEGKLRMDLMRVRRRKDAAARDLGYLTYQQSKGAVPAEGEAERLHRRIGDAEVEIERLEAQIRDLRGTDVTRPPAPPPGDAPPESPPGAPTP